MTAVLAGAARTLVVHEAGAADTSTEVAAGAVRACEKLHLHLARIVGEAGMQALFSRTLAISRLAYPWLEPPTETPAHQPPWGDLGAQVAAQPPAVAIDASVEVIATLVGLLARLIGDGLTLRLLVEVWPAIPPPEETT